MIEYALNSPVIWRELLNARVERAALIILKNKNT
jgi:hypothetical protein